jgi:predicted amidohydrolase YtcJ
VILRFFDVLLCHAAENNSYTNKHVQYHFENLNFVLFTKDIFLIKIRTQLIFFTRLLNLTSLLALIILTNGCEEKTDQLEFAEAIYFNGDIVTMMEEHHSVEGIATRDGAIMAAGSMAELNDLKGPGTKLIDLDGKALLPGFIDSHSHVAQGINALTEINISCPPVGKCERISDIIDELKRNSQGIEAGEWIMAWGYDNELIEEKRHPNVNDLDVQFPNNPVIMAHVSGHMVVCNSMALEIAHIDKTSTEPRGGVIEKDENGELTGLLQENAAFGLMPFIPQLSAEKKLDLIDDVLEQYAQNGYTTAQEGLSDLRTSELLLQARDSGLFIIDVVSLLDANSLDQYLTDERFQFNTYDKGLKFGGVKIIGDGSPQGKTAFFRKPYCAHGNCTLSMGFRGESNLSQQKLDSIFGQCYSRDIQVFMHCNGDAAIDMFIESHKTNKEIKPNKDYRPVIIHSQFVTKDQLQVYSDERLIPSFFTNHCYFWGDVHLKNLGEERGNFISPIATADSLGLIFTNHTDYRITPLDPMFVLWTATNRLSRSGIVIGASERATVYQALKALTINAAHQYFEEDSKGTLEVNKRADLVILSANPMKTPIEKLADIKILETIKSGQTIFKK